MKLPSATGIIQTANYTHEAGSMHVGLMGTADMSLVGHGLLCVSHGTWSLMGQLSLMGSMWWSFMGLYVMVSHGVVCDGP